VSTLYVVATPIGNLEDVTLRALRVLTEVPLVAAEDTRVTARLLSRHNIKARTVSFHAHSGPRRVGELLAALAEGDVAMVTDAGTPGISDPGAILVAAAREAGHRVEAVAGPSAVTAALSAAGMAADRFTFLGFLPRTAGERAALLGTVAELPWPLVMFEAPHRVRSTLTALGEALGDRETTVLRELTKVHEEAWHGTLTQARAEWAEREPRGEFTIVVAGAAEASPDPWSDDAILAAMTKLRREDVGARDASRLVAASAGVPAREVYALWHRGQDGAAESEGEE
jgi:16S rRNA (cytidine1402-2'-O)-methyltransferase